jgi:acetylornithine deacetylase
VRAPRADELRAEVSRRRNEILDWTMDLIRFPSENRPPSGAEAGAQDWLAGECRALGWETDCFLPTDVPGASRHRYWLTGREYPAGRRNVVGRWRGGGGGRSLLLSGHVDVAPFEPDAWTVCRPFEPKIVGERLYGRGSADMKGGIAASFWALRILQEMGFRPSGDLLFESLVDEEFAGGNGTLAARLKGLNADLAVLCEPTRMQVCPACLGAFLGDLTIRGRAGMPFMGREIPNPVFAAASAIRHFRDWQDAWRAQNDHPLFREEGKQLNLVLSGISSTIPGELTQMGIPLITALSWIIWCYPGMTEEEFYPRLRAFWDQRIAADPELAPFALDIVPTYHFVRPWQTPLGHPGVACAEAAFRQVTGRDAVVGGASFSCDLGVYGDPGGMPCLILGPRGDNLHAPDEWVLVEDVLSLAAIYAEMAVTWSGSS